MHDVLLRSDGQSDDHGQQLSAEAAEANIRTLRQTAVTAFVILRNFVRFGCNISDAPYLRPYAAAF